MHNQGGKSLSFFDIGGSGDLTGSAALFLATEVNQFCHREMSLDGVINHPAWMIQPGMDEQNLVPNKRLLTIHPSQRKTLLFSNTPKNQITSNKKLWNRVRISCP